MGPAATLDPATALNPIRARAASLRRVAAGDMSPISAYLATVLRLTRSLLAISARGTPSASIERISFLTSRGTVISSILPGRARQSRRPGKRYGEGRAPGPPGRGPLAQTAQFLANINSACRAAARCGLLFDAGFRVGADAWVGAGRNGVGSAHGNGVRRSPNLGRAFLRRSCRVLGVRLPQPRVALALAAGRLPLFGCRWAVFGVLAGKNCVCRMLSRAISGRRTPFLRQHRANSSRVLMRLGTCRPPC